jgi:hypothetical protein
MHEALAPLLFARAGANGSKLNSGRVVGVTGRLQSNDVAKNGRFQLLHIGMNTGKHAAIPYAAREWIKATHENESSPSR